MAKKKTPEPTASTDNGLAIFLTKKQAAMIGAMTEKFPMVEEFQLYVTYESGIGPTTRLRFTIDLAGENSIVTVDATDVTVW